MRLNLHEKNAYATEYWLNEEDGELYDISLSDAEPLVEEVKELEFGVVLDVYLIPQTTTGYSMYDKGNIVLNRETLQLLMRESSYSEKVTTHQCKLVDWTAYGANISSYKDMSRRMKREIQDKKAKIISERLNRKI